MTQKLSPDEYPAAALTLDDRWLEDTMQLEAEIPWLLDTLQGHERIIECGYGGGLVAQGLRAGGKDVLIVEGGAAACEQARADGFEVAHSMFEDFMPTKPADCVVASFVLEHVADPVALLRTMRHWAQRLVVVVGNAESWHRRLAVQMGIQAELDTLSARDHAVGHYCVFSYPTIQHALIQAGWSEQKAHGMMLKPLPNSMMMNFDARLVEAMCKVRVPVSQAANIGLVCERLN